MTSTVHLILDRATLDDRDTRVALDLQADLWKRGLACDVRARDVAAEAAGFVGTVDAIADDGPRVALAGDPLAALHVARVPLPGARSRSLVVLSSAEDDGIRPYALAIAAGLRANGHRVEIAGVRRGDAADLARAVRAIPRGTDAVVVEHEFALFPDVALVRALARLRLRRIPVVLSFHELEPEKFAHYRLITRTIHYRQRHRWPLEIVRIPWVSLRLASAFVRYRAVLWLLGALCARVVVHSARARLWADLLVPPAKIAEVPLVVRPLEAAPPATAAAKRALRERLGLPADRFVYVSPGFFFRRKRLVEVISAAPRDAVVVLSGTEADYSADDRGYLDEIRAFVRERGLENVVINTDFATMGDHVAAADCVVLYYADVFQSGIATQALWAGLPCVFSDAPGFRLYAAAGLFAADTVELRAAMEEARRPETNARLRRGAARLRELLDPARVAPAYLAGLEL